MKTVSSIIPAFNSARTLKQTVNSALAQSYPAHEIIIINDGSTDQTFEIASAICRANPNVRVVHQANRGLAGARNRGVAEASGDYIALLDADDIWHPHKLALQVAALDARPDAALAYGWFRRIDEADRVFNGSASPLIEGRAFHRHLDHNFISNGSSPLVVTSVARQIGFDETLDAGEDYLFQLRVAQHHAFACVPAYLTGYRLRPGSMSRDAYRMIRGHLAMFALLEREADAPARRIIARRIATFEVELARNRLRRSDLRRAVIALARSVRNDARAALAALATELKRTAAPSRSPRLAPGAARFADFRIDEPDGAWSSGRSPRRDAFLAALDGEPSADATSGQVSCD